MKEKPIATMVTFLIIGLAYAATFAAGVAAGHYHGKAVTLERFVLVTEQFMEGK